MPPCACSVLFSAQPFLRFGLGELYSGKKSLVHYFSQTAYCSDIRLAESSMHSGHCSDEVDQMEYGSKYSLFKLLFNYDNGKMELLACSEADKV